jgi:hypothetical protein
MSMFTSVTGAALNLAAGVDAAATAADRVLGLVSRGAGGVANARKADPITAKLATAKAATTKTKATTTKATTTKATTTKATTTKATTAASGYATSTSADFAFLKDPSLSVEEKLFRFMCAIAKRNDDEVVKKMEEMKGGTAKAASGTGSSSGTAAPKKSGGFSIWGALKALVPPLGLAAQVVGDAKLKSLISQVSGPVLAAACTALGMPALAPVAMQLGPQLASALVDGKVSGDAASVLGDLVGGGDSAGEAGGAASSASSASSTKSTGAASSSASTGKNEQVQMMELQRLVDKQKEMFAMISNVLRAQHDTRMAIIGNVR